MDAREELDELRRLDELEAKATGATSQASEPPSSLAVAGNAAAKGIAGFVDMFGNAPANLLNVGKYAAGEIMEQAGHPIWADMSVTPQPNLAKRGMEAVGLIKPENEPQTAIQRILDMAVQTGVGMAASPAASVSSGLRNVGLGLASGTAAGVTKEATGSDLAALAVGAAMPLATNRALASRANAGTLANPVKTVTLKDAQAAGYLVPPSQVKPSATTNKLEGMAGKAAVRQEAAIRNQEVTNSLAVKALGLPEGTPITKQAIQQVRDIAAKPYQEVETLRASMTNLPWFPRYHSASLLEELKQARADAQQTFSQYNRNADPATLAKAKAFRMEAESLEKDIQMVAKASGKPELMAQLKAGRQLYARTYDVERATNFADGNVNAQVLGAIAKKGKPLSGELAVIGKFAQAFPSVTRPGASVPASGVSGTDAAASALLGTVGYGAAGGPAGLIAAGLPLLRSPARAALLSKGYQSRLLAESPGLNQALFKSLLGGRAIAEAP